MFTISGGVGGAKTQPTGTMLEDVVVDELDVSLLDVVETTVEDIVLDELEVRTLEVVDVEVVPSNLRAMLAPRAITTTTRTAKATAILPIPLREVLTINRENKRGSIFKTYPGLLACIRVAQQERVPSIERTIQRARLWVTSGHEAHRVFPRSLPGKEARHRGVRDASQVPAVPAAHEPPHEVSCRE